MVDVAVDLGMEAIDHDYASVRKELAQGYARPSLDKVTLGRLVYGPPDRQEGD